MTKELSNSSSPPPAFRSVLGVDNVEIDLKNPDFHARADQYELLKYLRDNDPIYWNREIDGPGFWAVMRYEDVETVTRARDIFSADYKRGGFRINDIPKALEDRRPDIFTTDPPDHTVYRKAYLPVFSPEAVDTFKSSVQRRVRRVIVNVASQGHADFVSDIASPIVVGLLTDLIDLPVSDTAKLIQWSNALVGNDDSEYCPSIEYRINCVQELDRYVGELVKERAGSDRSDILTILTRLTVENAPLDVDAISESFASLIVATIEATRHTITRSMLTLSEFPDEKQKLLADLSLMPVATKEFLRWATPGIHARRTATRDTVLSGQEIKEGDKVVLWYKSANRDERRWADANQFRVDRFSTNNTPAHIAFGSGINHCLGWRYAEMQITLLFEELLAVLPDIHTVGSPQFLRSNFISGIKTLNVEFSPVSYTA